jgi:hypothetical protein
MSHQFEWCLGDSGDTRHDAFLGVVRLCRAWWDVIGTWTRAATKGPAPLSGSDLDRLLSCAQLRRKASLQYIRCIGRSNHNAVQAAPSAAVEETTPLLLRGLGLGSSLVVSGVQAPTIPGCRRVRQSRPAQFLGHRSSALSRIGRRRKPELGEGDVEQQLKLTTPSTPPTPYPPASR